MKNLFCLFFAITVACSSGDDSNGTDEPQSFFEKYDGVVWEEPDYSQMRINRLQFNNQSPQNVIYFVRDFLYQGSGEIFTDCNSQLLGEVGYSDYYFIMQGELSEINEDSFTLYREFLFDEDYLIRTTTSVEVIENGSKLTITETDNAGSIPTIEFNRTTLNQPCE